ncbi:MAG TPA: hypothetical protein VMW24_16580 [Sedimentisphaerales bacterium]|nr:hypothetical protein [Sedimentisphaerales bacterium]
MKVERTGSAVVTVRFDDVAHGWEHWVLLRSDAHHDSPACNRKLEKKHLDEMVAKDGSWCDFGDLFDAMQGKKDPRRNYDELLAEDKEEDYYDIVVRHAGEFYAPYANRCVLLGKGNHETKVLKHASTDLTGRLAKALGERLKNGGIDHVVHPCGYGGWVRYLFTINGTKTTQIRLKFHHGSGGSAPVTDGVIQTKRQAVYLPDAHIVINGHNHKEYILVVQRARINQRGRVYQDRQLHGRIPGYKDDYGDGTRGFGVERTESGPTPQGAIWLHLTHAGDNVNYNLIMTD